MDMEWKPKCRGAIVRVYDITEPTERGAAWHQGVPWLLSRAESIDAYTLLAEALGEGWHVKALGEKFVPAPIVQGRGATGVVIAWNDHAAIVIYGPNERLAFAVVPRPEVDPKLATRAVSVAARIAFRALSSVYPELTAAKAVAA